MNRRVVFLALLPILFPIQTAWAERSLEGFGASTQGGAGGSSYVVTSLADSGPGTFRDAVSSSDRTVTFAVEGIVELESTIRIVTDNLTIDGSTAPGSGVTITAAHEGVTGALLEIRGCHDIILRHVRIADAPDAQAGDNLRIWDGAYNVVVDHCSFRRAGDGNIDICVDAHDITIQWSILADTVKNSLIRTGLRNISIHHNLFIRGDERNPQLDDAASVDIVNNVIAHWSTNYGMRIRNGASANIVKNVFLAGPGSDTGNAVVIEGDAGPVYMEGNALPSSCQTDGTAADRLPAPPVTEASADEALEDVTGGAGARPLDQDDRDYIAEIVESPVVPASWGHIKAMYMTG